VRLLLVRHVHAGVRGTWPGDDLDRELSERGRAQAAALADAWRDAGIVAVHSSRAVRCTASVQPLADTLGLEVQLAPVLLEGARPAEALAWLEAIEAGDDEAVVACSHGDVIGGVLERLDERGTTLEGELRWPKASTWELRVEDGLIVHGRRHEPPAT
jgi:8-oxo-dGTP diphosphatase